MKAIVYLTDGSLIPLEKALKSDANVILDDLNRNATTVPYAQRDKFGIILHAKTELTRKADFKGAKGCDFFCRTPREYTEEEVRRFSEERDGYMPFVATMVMTGHELPAWRGRASVAWNVESNLKVPRRGEWEYGGRPRGPIFVDWSAASHQQNYR